MKQINFSAINLGCTKNLVDTEFVIGEILKTSSQSSLVGEKRIDQKVCKFNFFDNPEDKKVKYVILNTCSFLSSAREEAEDMMEYLDTLGKKIILIGCYISVKDDEFLMSLKNLEAVVSYRDIENIGEIFVDLCHSGNQTPILNSFSPDPRVKHEDDIRGKDEATSTCHSDFVAFPSLVGERVRVRAKNQLECKNTFFQTSPQPSPFEGEGETHSTRISSSYVILGQPERLNQESTRGSRKGVGNKGMKYKVPYHKEKLEKYLKSIGGDQIKNVAHIFGTESVRALLNAEKGYEYLKISEGCNNKCSFCIIPNIRGKQKSRPIEDIIKEVKIMLNSGIKEIEIIAQDTTRYGIDLYKTSKLLELLEEIDKIPGDFKYRLFYMYPDILTLKHFERLSKLKKILPYFDIPFQHISPKILKRMGRFYDDKHIYEMINYIKSNFKNPFFHTNFIIGFPGEDEEDFEKLLDFTKKVEFDSVSVFGYHDEPLANSSKLDKKISEKIIRERVKKLKKVLNEIYEKKEKARKGREEFGFIEEIFEDYVLVRPEIKAPEIDELDEVRFENILEGSVGVGERVRYIL